MIRSFNKIYIIFLIVMLVLPLKGMAAEKIAVDPSEIGLGARPLGLGRAYVGIAEGPNSIFLNPAGLAEIEGIELTSMYSRVLNEINYTLIGGTYPTEYGMFGFGYVGTNVGEDYVTTRDPVTGRIIPGGGTVSYSSMVLLASYGRPLEGLVPDEWIEDMGFEEEGYIADFLRRGTVGASLKIFMSDLSGGTVGGKGFGLDLDLGAKYRPYPWLTVGLTQQNVLPRSLGGKITWDSGTEETIPYLTKIGGAVKLLGKDSLLNPKYPQDLLVASDVDISLRGRPILFHLGVEWWPEKYLALRLGLDQDAQSAGGTGGVSVGTNLALGVGLIYDGFQFDYAYHQHGGLSENNTHYFSLSYVGEKEKEEIVEEIVVTPEVEPEEIFTELPLPEEMLLTFSDVYEDFWAAKEIEEMASVGIMGGFPDGTFRPDDVLNRAEFTAVLINALGEDLPPAEREMFKDLSTSHWAAKYINRAVQYGFISGYKDGTFRPDKKISRAEAIVSIAYFAGLPIPQIVAESPYPDIDPQFWAAKEISAVRDDGLLEYLEGRPFRSSEGFTRAEAAFVLARTEAGEARIKEVLGH